MSKHKDDPNSYPTLGRWMSWVDRPGSATKLFWGLMVACVIVFLLDFTYKKYGHFDMEYIPGFYAMFGFVMFTGLIFVAKFLRLLVKAPEDTYAPKSVDAEEYPDEGTERINHDA